MAIIFGWLLADRLADISLSQTQSALFGVTPGQWLAATIATALSFWAIGQYDGVIHRYLATGISAVSAHRAGATAIAVSQTLGLGVITGAIVRWRMLPGLSLWQATKLTSLVALFFLCGWASVTSLVLALMPQAPYRLIAVCFVVVAPIAILVCTLHPPLLRGHLPNLFIIARLVTLAAVDLLTAALALWVLCPPDLALPFAALLPAFLIAFGAGLISGTPGGVGAFEITLLALLPDVADTPLMAAVLAWRLVYFAIPALLGALIALRGPAVRRNPTSSFRRAARPHPPPKAEAGLSAQGQLALCAIGHHQAWLTGRTPHCYVALLDPLLSGGSEPSDLGRRTLAIVDLIGTSASESRLPVLYKCSARTAVAARRLGLSLLPVAREAWLDPRAFSLDAPSRAGLRRKLRHADRSGISIQTGPHDWSRLAVIAAEWATKHGGEKGFSMGRFERNYLADHRIFVACVDNSPVAFASFHAAETEWTLDLMRHTSCAPAGAMQALIVRAIADARALGLPRLSLAAVPLAALSAAPKSRLARAVHRLLGGNLSGLAQFKSAFVPQWQTLYVAAPHKPALALAVAEIAREVHFPPPLPMRPHHLHEQYEIASAG